MSSSFANSFDHFGGDSPAATGTHSFDDSHLAPHSFPNFDSTLADSHPPIYVSGGEFTSDPACFSSETNDNGPILPPPAEMEHDECCALREWRSLKGLGALCEQLNFTPDMSIVCKACIVKTHNRVGIWDVSVVNRQNTIRLEEKEKREKELLSQILVQADEYKVEFHRKRQASSETKRVTNREKEQVFVASQEKFHAEADKDYWKSIAEIIPKEVPTMGKRKGKKDEEKKPSIVVVQGPKPGKPSDLSRMRQILLKLKHNTPPHLKESPTAPTASTSAVPAVAATMDAVAVA